MRTFKIRHCEYLLPNEDGVMVTLEDSNGKLFSGIIKEFVNALEVVA